MANTEGIPDEDMTSLLSLNRDAGIPNTKRSPSAFKKSSLEKRMAMIYDDPGERPAATVTRSSNRKNGNRREPPVASTQEKAKATEQTDSSSAPMLGSIVERPLHQQGQRTRLSPLVVPPLGLPSVRVPLGTFVAPNQTKKKENQSPAQPVSNHRVENGSVKSIRETSRHDADAMLAQMSNEEIRENVAELQAALSPETIEFLKLRKRANQSNSKGPSTTKTDDNKPTIRRTTDRSLKTKISVDNKALQQLNMVEPTKPMEEDDRYASTVLPDIPTNVDMNNDEFHQACVLLRSTSPQQVLWAARTVSHTLVELQQSDRDDSSVFDIPTPLPVSLRCLLDEVPGGGVLLLHTHVLQALYALMCLKAPTDHVIHVSQRSRKVTNVEASAVYQQNFMDDCILTPPLDECYSNISMGEPLKMGKDTVAYSTLSSTTSAHADGEAFLRDPGWTLLSRMRILPRLAKLLLYNLPDEALEAVCGILAMLAVRSPGAAAAIAQHAELVPRLLQRLELVPSTSDTSEGSSHDNPASTYWTIPLLTLFNSLARQSRVVASSLTFDLVVPPILGQTPASEIQYQVQKRAVMLWRIMVRYGLGLTHVKTFVTLAVSHISKSLLCTIGDRPECCGLATEYLIAFTVVCEYAAAVQSDPSMTNERLSSEASDALLDTDWLSSLAKQCLFYVRSSAATTSAMSENNLDGLKLSVACLRLVSSSLLLETAVTEKTGNRSVSREDVKHYCDVGRELMGNVGVKSCMESAAKILICVDCRVRLSLACEAVSCALLEAFLQFLMRLVDVSIDQNEEFLRRSRAWVLDLISTWTATESSLESSTASHVPRARMGWLNKTHLSLCRFLLQTPLGEEAQRDLTIIRSVAFTLLARLQHGEEAIADFLFRHMFLFQTKSQKAGSESQSPLPAVFLREIYFSEQSRIQLSHSYQLLGYRLSDDLNARCFALDTLLSTADSRNAKQPLTSSELLLPLGRMWLWHILSSSVVQSVETPAAPDSRGDDVTPILTSCLELLVEMEQNQSLYSKQISNGAKLYHLFNMCLYSEDVIRDEKIGGLTRSLFGIYTQFPEAGSLEHHFIDASLRHSLTAKKIDRPAEEISSDEKKMFDSFFGDEGDELSTKEMASLESFVGDMCNAYLEYGAQYDVFTECVRFFLRPGFPVKIRCETIRQLGQVLHLLILPGEALDSSAMATVLKASLAGGLPSRDGSSRDAPKLLDMFASVLCGSGSDTPLVRVSRGDYCFLLAIASLARSLAMNAIDTSMSIQASKRRLKDIPKDVLELIWNSSARLLSSVNGDTSDLVSSVVEVCMEPREHHTTLIPCHDDFEDGMKYLRSLVVLEECPANGLVA